MQKESKATTTDTQAATFDHGDLQVVWQHRSWGHSPDPDYPWGATIYGENGTLKLSVHRYDFTPRGKGKALQGEALYELDKYPEDRTEEALEKHVASAIRGHMKDLLAAIDKRGKPVADIEQGHISSASCMLANVACDLGRSLEWDPVKGRVVGDEEANRRLRRPYRKPWVHPEVDSV